MTPEERKLRTEIVEHNRRMNRLGLNTGTTGNISVRFGDGFLITPTGVDDDALTPDMIVPMKWDATFAGGLLPSSEWRFHRDILFTRPEFGAIVHTHSTHATAVSILGHDLPAIHYMIAAAGGATIRCAPYAVFGSSELAQHAVAALEGRRACLLAHHGVIAAHASLPQALTLALIVESLAQQYLALLPLGRPPTLSQAQMTDVLEKFQTYGQQPPDPLAGTRRAD